MNSKQNEEQLEKDPNQANIERDLQRAIDLHQTGKLQQAELIYQQILQTHPQHSTALHLLGVIAYQSDNLAMAVGLIEQATKIDPNQSIKEDHGNSFEKTRKKSKNKNKKFRKMKQSEYRKRANKRY